MIIATEAVKAWLEADPTWAAKSFQFALGKWTDSPNNAQSRIALLSQGGGRAPVPDVGFDGVSLVLLGPQKGQMQAGALQQIAVDIRQRLFTDYKVCGVTQIRLVGGIIGPGYTTENRPWIELSLEVIT